MQPTTPAATPSTSNVNDPFGGASQAQGDYNLGSNILNSLPTQLAATANFANTANTNTASILPEINISTPTYTAPSIPANPTTSTIPGLINEENATMGSALGTLTSAEQEYGNITPVYQQLATDFNIPTYQNEITNLNGLLNSLASDVNVQTNQGVGETTTAARNEAYEQQYQPLSNYLGEATQALQYGQTDVNNLVNTYEQSLQNQLQPLETNISQLPTMFGQTNAGVQDVIQNAISQQQATAATQQAASYAEMVKAEYGAAGSEGNVISALGGTGTGQLLPGITLKNSKTGGSAGYNFTSTSGSPTSAATWAINNASQFGTGTSTAQAVVNMIYSMAANGDQTANQAYTEIEQNNGTITSTIMNKYPSLFWGSPGGPAGASSTNSGGLQSSAGTINPANNNTALNAYLQENEGIPSDLVAGGY